MYILYIPISTDRNAARERTERYTHIYLLVCTCIVALWGVALKRFVLWTPHCCEPAAGASGSWDPLAAVSSGSLRIKGGFSGLGFIPFRLRFRVYGAFGV